MKKLCRCIFLALLVALASQVAKATHIVGGEFELSHVGDSGSFQFRLDLILYFDVRNGLPGAEDQSITVSIFQKSNDQRISTHSLPQVSRRLVEYSNPSCFDTNNPNNPITRRLQYSTLLTLDPAVYNHPEGYYVSWERCCRNNGVVNIIASGSVGQTFYLEFPPVVDADGAPFVNSTPGLFPPLSDYGCVGRLYYTEFTGSDADGDSLSYQLVTPLAGFAGPGNPIPDFPSPAPYPPVQWANGFSDSIMITGVPPLQLSTTGYLTVRPWTTGLYVFALEVTEWRDSVAIGRVRREFQMFVVAGCLEERPPVAAVRLPDEDFFRTEVDTIRYASNEPKCLDLVVTDRNDEENVTLEIFPVNFDAKLDDLLTLNSGTIDGESDSLKLQLCLPECPYLRDEPYIIDLVAKDDACALPQMDTLRLIFEVEAPFNRIPFYSSGTDVAITINEGEVLSYVFEGIDLDQDSLFLEVQPEGFALEDYGMDFITSQPVNGQMGISFDWDSRCELYDFQAVDYFEMALLLHDVDTCNWPDADTLWMRIQVETPPNTEPEISTSLGTDTVTLQLESTLSFQVFGTDADNDSLFLSMEGSGFDPATYGMQFSSSPRRGSVLGTFSWSPDCGSGLNLELQDQLTLYFLVEDSDKCTFINYDTATVVVNLLPPPNEAPRFVGGFTGVQRVELPVGSTFQQSLKGQDTPGDSLLLVLLGEGLDSLARAAITFNGAQGVGSVEAPLGISPSCAMLPPDSVGQSKVYTYTFLLTDDVCFNDQADTLVLEVEVTDGLWDLEGFRPANVVTPNSDGQNDVWTLWGHDNPARNLPQDNCARQFERIQIFNRWGRPLYSSTNPQFAWAPGNAPSGVYYYHMAFYGGFALKGVVSVLR